MSEPIISVSGLRGIVGESLTPEVAIRYTAAFAAAAPPGLFLVGRDSRPSGRMLSETIQSGLQALGQNTLDLGIVATPTVGVLVRHFQAAGAIQITASHNPSPYNGIKLFSHEGRVIPADQGAKVLETYRTRTPQWKPADAIGEGQICEDTVTAHLTAILDIVDAQRIRQRRFRVVLDSNHGAGSLLGRRLLHELACRVTVLGDLPNGQFAHSPEPLAENLASVLPKVCEEQADVGFCQDPDADRLALIDESGRYIGEEYTLALCADHVLSRQKGPLVANCSSSRMSQDVAKKHGVPFFRSAVGEANVVDAMLARNAVFGGEGNGGPIDPRVVLVRDSFVGMALILDALATRNQTISEWAGQLPRYEIVKTKTAFPPAKLPQAFEALQRRFSEANPDRLDGLRLDWPDRWLLVRGSNTEPIVRIIAEAPTAEEAGGLCQAAGEVLKTLNAE
ncbi:MAG: phosphoglucosamine mutase [Pirellulales bacterium]|nr:phosphoglucosamine mutase [Pirellulales bacterium]